MKYLSLVILLAEMHVKLSLMSHFLYFGFLIKILSIIHTELTDIAAQSRVIDDDTYRFMLRIFNRNL